jgi:hypothetical protein
MPQAALRQQARDVSEEDTYKSGALIAFLFKFYCLSVYDTACDVTGILAHAVFPFTSTYYAITCEA